MICRAESNSDGCQVCRGIVVSDRPELSGRLKSFLSSHLWRCDADDVVPGVRARQRLRDVHYDLVVCVLPPDIPQAESLLSEVRAVSPGPLVAVGSADDPKLILRALHEGGADKYVDIDHFDEELGHILERLRPIRRGNLVAVVGPGGGAGASTIAANLAVLLSQPKTNCLLIDMNLEFGAQSSLLDVKPKATIVDLCRNLERVDSEMFGQLLTPHKSGVVLLAAPMQLGEAKWITPDGTKYALDLASQLYPNCVVDADPCALARQVDLYRRADVVLLIVSPSIQGLDNVRKTLACFEQMSVDLRRLLLVVNRSNAPHHLRFSQVRKSFRDFEMEFLPYDPKRIIRSCNVGVPIVIGVPQARFSRKLRSISERLRQQVPPPAPASPDAMALAVNREVP